MSEFEHPDHEWIHEQRQRADDEEVLFEIAREAELSATSDLDKDSLLYNELGGRGANFPQRTSDINDLSAPLPSQGNDAKRNKTADLLSGDAVAAKRQNSTLKSSLNNISQRQNAAPDFINRFKSVGRQASQDSSQNTAQTRTSSFLKPAIRKWEQGSANANSQAFKPLPSFNDAPVETQKHFTQRSKDILPEDRIVYPTERTGGLRSTVTRRSHEKWRQNNTEIGKDKDDIALSHADTMRAFQRTRRVNGQDHLSAVLSKASRSQYEFNSKHTNSAHDQKQNSAKDATYMDVLKPISAETAAEKGILRNLNESDKSDLKSQLNARAIDQKLLFGGVEPFRVENIVKKAIHTKPSVMQKIQKKEAHNEKDHPLKSDGFVAENKLQERHRNNDINNITNQYFEDRPIINNPVTSPNTHPQSDRGSVKHAKLVENTLNIAGLNRNRTNSQSAFQRLETFRKSISNKNNQDHLEEKAGEQNSVTTTPAPTQTHRNKKIISWDAGNISNIQFDTITLLSQNKKNSVNQQLKITQPELPKKFPIFLIQNKANNHNNNSSIIDSSSSLSQDEIFYESQLQIHKEKSQTNNVRISSVHKSAAVMLDFIVKNKQRLTKIVNKKSVSLRYKMPSGSAISAACIGFVSLVILLNLLTGTTAAGSITPPQPFDAWVTDVFKPLRVFLGAPG